MARFYMLLTCCWLAAGQVAQARHLTHDSVPTALDCSPSDQLVVLSGDPLAPLLGAPLRRLSLFRVSATGLAPIAFQVDRRDAQGRYIIDEPGGAGTADPVLQFTDELVFLASDTGVRLTDVSKFDTKPPLVEIRVGGPADALSGWVYASVSLEAKTDGIDSQLEYDPGSDTVSSAIYQVGFNRRLPFLMNTFRWKTDDPAVWSQNLIDTMKIRHQGRFLGFIPFQRTQRDYTSRLIGTKTGPLRVIRRTENRIRMLWHLKTPSVYIDYVMMPAGFVMDTVIDIPFDVGLFFGRIETVASVDWDGDTALPRLTIYAPGHQQPLSIDGDMSREERDFNSLQLNKFGVTSSLGKMLVSLDIPPSVPLTSWLYLRDALEEADPPEERIGQFGNVGFRITGWEQINSQVQHVKFAVCLENAE